MTVLVTGATGTVGRELVKQLSAAGVPVRALVRDLTKGAALHGPLVELIEGDLARPATLTPALAGVDKVFLASAVAPEQVELQGNLIRAAREAGVAHLVKLSALGADEQSPVSCGRWHRQTEQQLERELPYTHLQPHYFMQNFLMFAPSIAASGVFFAPMKKGRMPMVDARDIASVAARVLTEPGHEYQTYVLTGPEALSFGEAAAVLSRVLGKEISYVPVTDDDALAAMVADGLPAWLAEALVALYQIFSTDGAAEISPVVQELTGQPGIRFERFARDYAQALS